MAAATAERVPAPNRMVFGVLAVAVMLTNAPWTLAPEAGAAIIALLLAFQPRRYRVVVPLPLVLLVAWMAASVMWSLAPLATVRDVVRNGLLMVDAWLLLLTLGWRRTSLLVGTGTTLLCLVCLGSWVTDPAGAYTPDGLKGVLPQNNSLGYVAAVAVSALVVHGITNRWSRSLIGLLLIAVTTLVLSQSMTSIVAGAGALAVCAVVTAARRGGTRHRRLLVVELLVAVALLGVVLPALSLTDLVGRDATLTGRTDIWPEMLRIANSRWLIGWGQGAPWVDGSWIRSWSEFHFDFHMISTHNAFLETYLQLGLVGVVLLVLLWGRGLLLLPRLVWTSGTALWAVCIAVFHLAHGMAESSQGAPLTWLLVPMVWLVTVPRITDERSEPPLPTPAEPGSPRR